MSEVTAAVEASVRSADAIKASIFSGDIKIASSATEALKLQLTRNVELLSSLNALLFPQPGAGHSMEFSRCGGSLVHACVSAKFGRTLPTHETSQTAASRTLQARHSRVP